MKPQRRKKKRYPAGSMIVLRLYIVEGTFHSVNAVANLHALCEKYLPNRFRLEIIDVIDHPRQIIRDRILATPTLIKLSPSPKRTIIGDLSDERKVLAALGVPPGP